MGFPASHNTWEPPENIRDNRLISSFHKKHPRARRLNADPDYVPNNVALLSWTESSANTTTVASLAPGHKRCIFSSNGPLTNPGCAPHGDIVNSAATPKPTQVPVIRADADEGLIPG